MKISKFKTAWSIRIAILVSGVLFAASSASAQTGDAAAILSAYKQYKDIAAAQINGIVPTVVQVPLDQDILERTDFAVLDMTTDRFEPSYFFESQIPTTLSATSDDTQVDTSELSGNDSSTYASFDVPGDRTVRSIIRLHAAHEIETSHLSIMLADNVALPRTIAIREGVNGKVIVAEKPLGGATVLFPQTRGVDWVIELTHVQPLRITEIRFVEELASPYARAVRFLAQPNHSYKIYFNPDRNVVIGTGESGDLSGARDIRTVTAETRTNSTYIPADVDADGIQDLRDNCVSIANPDQSDVDQNGLGDTCQDFDNDHIANVTDNCPDAPNANQVDTDGDGTGDVCDGEESRLTEKYKWIPWAGIGFAALVIIALFGITIVSKKEDAHDPQEN